MASSSPAFNSHPDPDPDPDPAADAHRKKRRKIEAGAEDSDRDRGAAAGSEIRWRSPAQQRLYSAKLVEALSRSRRRSSSSSSSGGGGGGGGADAEPAAAAAPATPSSGPGEVRGIADRVLATAAKGRTRWSRAILASRLRMGRLGKRHRKARAPSAGRAWLRKPPPPPPQRRPEGVKRRLPAVERRVRVLGRLVPGCRGIPVSNLLEETSDYIAALEMQVRAMSVLTQLLSGSQPPSDLIGLGSGSGSG